MKKFTLLLAFFTFVGMQVFAQTTVTGIVTDSEGPLPGVNVTVKGTSLGAMTEPDGQYSIVVPEGSNTLVFSYIGMLTKEVLVRGNLMNVVLESNDVNLKEFVVTALGLVVNKDKVTGSITSIGAEDMKNTGESGIIQGLAGKTSGINIVQNTGDPGAGAYIQIRGQNTITGSNQPLFIIDGVPIINSTRGTQQSVAQQSRLNDINPNDIETIDVLKGASAAAVWGTRAANGVIIITTKSGKGKAKGVSVDLNVGFTIDQISTEFEKQTIFGQGKGGVFVANRGESWGDKISERAGGEDEVDMTGKYFEAESGTKYYPILTKNSRDVFDQVNRDQVFRNGFASDISAGINLKNDNSNTYISIADWNQKGIINGQSDYHRTNLRLNYKTNIGDKLSFKVNSLYSNISSNRIQQGSNTAGLYLGYLRGAVDFDNTDYKGTYYDNNGIPSYNAHRSYRRYLGDSPPSYGNPGWVINEQVNTSEVSRIMINPELQYDIAKGDKLSSKLTIRFGNDMSIDKRITFFPVNSVSSRPSGIYTESWYIEKEHTFEAFDRTVHTFDNMSIAWILGAQYNIRSYNYHSGTMTDFINTDDQLFDYANATNENKTPSNYKSEKHTAAGYLVLNADLYDEVFIELTSRMEKSNSFSNVIVYPSVSAAWQFTNSLVPKNDILSFGKLRASFGTVGIEPPLYVGGTDYISVDVTSRWLDLLDAAAYGGGLRRSKIQGNENLNPERKTEFELGADLRLFKDYLSVNATVYQNRTTGAIFAVDVPASTGYSSKWENAATLSNKGFELDIVGNILKKGDFKWNVNLNFSTNKNIVEDLQGVESIKLDGHTTVSSRAVEGYALGTLWGGRWDRDANGTLILDVNGFPTQALEQGVIGDPNPDFMSGLGSDISYKGLSLGILFEISQGGDMWAGSYAVMNHFGTSLTSANEVTLTQDVVNYSGSTIAAGSTVRGNLQDFGAGEVLLDQKWYTSMGGGFGPVGEQFINDASFIRLRELSLSYALPQSILKKVNLSSATLSLYGRNLILWSEFADNYGVDPKTNLYGTSNGRGLDYFTNPSTKSYGFKLSLGI